MGDHHGGRAALRRQPRESGVTSVAATASRLDLPEPEGPTTAVVVAATASRLDLPEPEGPTTAVVVPASTARLTASNAVNRPSPSG
ncbi:hypothetical protein [Saccharothrix sp.]|uniref:hypothetical protein n=1 Tax=Saccharothrix sp. TaxID=1873460 RepID=UPI0035C7A64E